MSNENNEGFKIKSLHIEDYKMFKDFDIDFVDKDDNPLPIVVLAGVNGSGKTTLLEYLTDLPIEKNEYKIEYILDAGTFDGLSRLNCKEFHQNIIYFSAGIDETVKVESEFVKSFYHFLKNRDFRPSEVKSHFHEYMTDIFVDIDLTFKYTHLDKDDNVWFMNSNGKEFMIDALSTGEKTLISKVLYLYFQDYKNKVILIDEPELSLHPSWQNRVLKIYENFAKANNCQVIIATHSPHIIGSAKSESLRILKKVDEKIEAFKYSQSYGFEFDKILTDIMGVENLRTPEIAEDIKRLWELLKKEAYQSKEYQELYQKLEKLLGDLDQDLLLARLEVAKIKSRNA